MADWKVDLANAVIRVYEIPVTGGATKLFRWTVYAEHGANRDLEPVFGAYQEYTRGDITDFLDWFARLMGEISVEWMD